jgi:hypothetical protein
MLGCDVSRIAHALAQLSAVVVTLPAAPKPLLNVAAKVMVPALIAHLEFFFIVLPLITNVSVITECRYDSEMWQPLRPRAGRLFGHVVLCNL